MVMLIDATKILSDQAKEVLDAYEQSHPVLYEMLICEAYKRTHRLVGQKKASETMKVALGVKKD